MADCSLDAGAGTIVLGSYHGMRKPSGKKFPAQSAHDWTVAGGKATRFRQYTDTLALAASAR